MVRTVNEATHKYLTTKIAEHDRTVRFLIALALFSSVFIPVLGFLGVLCFSALFILALGIGVSADRYRKGLAGERRVIEMLEFLPDTYYLLNDIVFNPTWGNVDHIVIGSNGLFVIETKNLSGRITCHGDEWYVQRAKRKKRHRVSSASLQVKRNTGTVRGLLAKRVPEVTLSDSMVHSIVVLPDPSIDLVTKKCTVTVLPLRALVSTIIHMSSPSELTFQEIDQLAEAIMQSTVRENTGPV